MLPPTPTRTSRSWARTRATSGIFLSSNTERRLVERSRELGAADYLPKQTTDPATLFAVVSTDFALVLFRRSRDG